MPEDKEKEKPKKKGTIDDFVTADHLGVDTKKIQEQNKQLSELDEKIRKINADANLRSYKTTSTMDKTFDLMKNSMTNSSIIQEELEKIKNDNKTSSGVRSLNEMTINPEENKIIDMYKQNIQNSFVQMNEHRIVCKIIPELKKVVSNVVRDIINANETDKRFITNIYEPDKTDSIDKTELSDLNNYLDKEIVLKYNLEPKIKQFLNEALITGAKPIVILPYKDIYESIKQEFENSSLNGKISTEDYLERKQNVKSLYAPKLSEKYFNAKNSNESLRSTESYDELEIDPNEDVYDNILGNSVEEWFNIDMEDYKTSYYDSKSKVLMHRSIESDEDLRKFIDENEKTIENHNNQEENDTITITKKHIKKQLVKLINDVDLNLDIIDPVNAAFKMASKHLKQNWKFHQLHEGDDYIKVDANPVRRTDAKIDKKFNNNITNEPLVDNPNSFASDPYYNQDNNLNINKKSKKFSGEKDMFLNEALILDFDPENVIPIIVNGLHVSYYIVEEEAYNGGFERNRKVSFTFMDIVSSLGVGNDDTVTSGGNALMGNFGTTPMGFSNLPQFGQNINLSSISTMSNVQTQNDNSMKRNEILRDIVLRTISTKMNNKDIIENKVFRDCVMNLLRQGYIIKRKTIFTNVPSTNVVYFCHNMTSTGLPTSIYADTLFYSYIYISSLISSLMIKLAKSANKDVVKFETSKDGNYALTAQLIDNGLSTRQMHSVDTFSNIHNVLKNSATHDRIIIPKINGQEMIEYEQVQKMNDIDIDDQFTEKMLEKIIRMTDINMSSLNKLSEEEYSRSIIVQQLNYLNALCEMQVSFSSQVTKMLRLLIKYMDIPEEYNKYLKGNELSDHVNFKFSTPKDLYLTNARENISTVTDFVDSVTSVMFGERANEDAYKAAVEHFKTELIKTHATNIDWSLLQELYDVSIKESTALALKDLKYKKRFEQIQEIDVTNSEDDSGDSYDSGGGYDDGGYDSGGDESGGDFSFGDEGGEQEGGSDEDEGLTF